MFHIRQSDCFEINFFFWKLFGIWPGKTSNKYYTCFSIIFLFVTLIVYNLILTVNLYYTPSEIDILIREVLFYFNEIAISTKVITVLFFRITIREVLDILDCDEFKGVDENARNYIKKDIKMYKMGWKIYAFLCNFSYFSEVIVPIITHMIWGSSLHLPISNYHFLSDEIRDRYFTFWFIYQAACMYGHMMYNVNMDSFIAGLIFLIITQVRILKANFENIKLSQQTLREQSENMEHLLISKLKECLRHYDIILKLSSKVQKIISVTTFVQFGMTSAIICVSLCWLLTPSASDIHLFLVTYLIGMTSRIFVPAWLGTQLTHKSQNLVSAAYNSEWIKMPEIFKRNMIIFLVRANIPIILIGMKMFPVSLRSFTSILKTAYSLFTLICCLYSRSEYVNYGKKRSMQGQGLARTQLEMEPGQADDEKSRS